MEAILIKVFATALALSQVTTRPDAVKTEFDPIQDKTEVMQMLNAGCLHMRKAFDIENLNLDELLETAMTDTQALGDEIKAFKGVKFKDLHIAYRQVCKNENVEQPVVDAGQVIEFYNQVMVDLPDHTRLKGMKLRNLAQVLDGKGGRYAEIFEPQNRRVTVPLSDVPRHVQAAFIAAEDKRFREHKGIDERSVIRAFLNTVAEPNKRQGGSTITQQVVKNLLVGDALSYERKTREIVVAARLEQALTKDEILELYLNSIYLGRGAWGIEMASRVYFNKPAKDLTVLEGAFLAGLPKGPNYYNPDRHPVRAKERLAYVLSRMEEDGVIDHAQLTRVQGQLPVFVAYSRPRRDQGFHFVDQLAREARTAGVNSLTAEPYTVRTTIVPALQHAAEIALQEGLAKYEQRSGRVSFRGAEANLGDAIRKLETDPKFDRSKPAWLVALERAQPPLYDVHWTPAVVVERLTLKGGVDSIRVGLRDGRVLPLSTFGANTRRNLQLHDLIYVAVTEAHGKQGTRVELRVRPTVQGAVVVLENSTGRILAMVGGFSYPLSQLNRATQSRRQPGSSFKPMTYLAALAAGLQPNTLIDDAPLTLPPIGNSRYAQIKDYWSPKNYDGGTSGTMTLRRALENSKNLVTARLLQGGVAMTPEQSLDKICDLSIQVHLYGRCERYYPFVLGAQPVRPIDLAAFYATVANEGAWVEPHAIETIEQNGQVIYRHRAKAQQIGAADKPAFFQLKSILQGVLARGTARSIGQLSPFVAGKTGTSDDENDAWFVGFSNDVTVAVWVGYDNSGRTRRTLGHGATGSRVAIPIFEPVMQAVWQHHAPKTALRGPSPEASRQLIALPIDLNSGTRLHDRSYQTNTYANNVYSNSPNTTTTAFREYFRLDPNGRLADTHHRLASRYDYDNIPDPPGLLSGDRPLFDPWFGNRRYDNAPPRPPESVYRRQQQPPPFFFPFFGDNRPSEYERRPQPVPQPPTQQQQRQYRVEPQPQRINPDYFWGNRQRF